MENPRQDRVVSSPKISGRFKKKQKNDTGKKAQQDSRGKNPAEQAVANVTKKTAKHDLEDGTSVEGIKAAGPEKKNWAESRYFQKKKIFEPYKKKNSDWGQTNQQCNGDNKMNRGSNNIEANRRDVDIDWLHRWYDFFLANPSELVLLDRNHVILLQRIETKRPQAQFMCRLCNYFCDSLNVVSTHIKSLQHLKHIQDMRVKTTLKKMPPLTVDQMAVINSFLLKKVAVNCMNPSDLETRRIIQVLVSNVIAANLKGCTTRLFGSSVHGMGLKTADVNIDLQVPEGSLPSAMLKEVAALLAGCGHFIDILENFDCEIPYVGFTYKRSKERCALSLNNERAVHLSTLLSKYTPLDPRVTYLASLFRLWGKITHTDKAEDGSWPGYTFYLMTVFYLQQCKEPVLPVLNDLLTDQSGDSSANTTKVLNLTVSEIKARWNSSNQQSLGSLWIGLLRFYAVDFNYHEHTISIDSSARIACKAKKIFIVDPFVPTRNVARSICSDSMFRYIINCLKTTCKYFCIPQTPHGPMYNQIYMPIGIRSYPREVETCLTNHSKINSMMIQVLIKMEPVFFPSSEGLEMFISSLKKQIRSSNYSPSIDKMPAGLLDQRNVERARRSPQFQALYKDMAVTVEDARLLLSSYISNEFTLEYHFRESSFTGGQKFPRVCTVCKSDGHLKHECPEERLSPLDPINFPLPPLTVGILDNICQYVFSKWNQGEGEVSVRETICREMESFVQESYPTANLQLYGSTMNGFGLRGSDLDICLTFTDNKTGEGLDAKAFIEILYKILKSYTSVQDLVLIATARVPIVKFCHTESQLEGDISLYNVLALENSRLLNTYSKIDIRALMLGIMMKRFSKICNIGDASKGSLSSYAYTLIVIYFLQHCDPPVLPVLQELTESGGPCPTHIVEGCNAYFFGDLSKLDTVWSGQGQNRQSPGELWLGLLIYYTEQFDLQNNVIAIRCSRTLPKFEKLWISKGIAIEDPFDLNHNLGSALTRKMALYIIKTMRKARNFFGHPILCSHIDLEAYYLNEKLLTDGEPPNDRGCRFCRSVKHKVRDCPLKRKNVRGKCDKNQDQGAIKKEVPEKMLNPMIDDEDEEFDDDDFDDDDVKDEAETVSKPTVRNSNRPVQIPTNVPTSSFYGPPGFAKPEKQPTNVGCLRMATPNTQRLPNMVTKQANNTPKRIYTQPIPTPTPPLMYNISNPGIACRPIMVPVSELERSRFPAPPQNGQQIVNCIPYPPEQNAATVQNSWNNCFNCVPLYQATRPVLMNKQPVMVTQAEHIVWGPAPSPPTETRTLESTIAKLQLAKTSKAEGNT